MSDLKVGDKILILEDHLMGATVFAGDILEVVKTYEDCFHTEAPSLVYMGGVWCFVYGDEGTGWEKYEGEK